MLRQLYSTMGETGVPVLPSHEGWACRSPGFVLGPGAETVPAPKNTLRIRQFEMTNDPISEIGSST